MVGIIKHKDLHFCILYARHDYKHSLCQSNFATVLPQQVVNAITCMMHTMNSMIKDHKKPLFLQTTKEI